MRNNLESNLGRESSDFIRKSVTAGIGAILGGSLAGGIGLAAGAVIGWEAGKK